VAVPSPSPFLVVVCSDSCRCNCSSSSSSSSSIVQITSLGGDMHSLEGLLVYSFVYLLITYSHCVSVVRCISVES